MLLPTHSVRFCRLRGSLAVNVYICDLFNMSLRPNKAWVWSLVPLLVLDFSVNLPVCDYFLMRIRTSIRESVCPSVRYAFNIYQPKEAKEGHRKARAYLIDIFLMRPRISIGRSVRQLLGPSVTLSGNSVIMPTRLKAENIPTGCILKPCYGKIVKKYFFSNLSLSIFKTH